MVPHLVVEREDAFDDDEALRFDGFELAFDPRVRREGVDWGVCRLQFPECQETLVRVVEVDRGGVVEVEVVEVHVRIDTSRNRGVLVVETVEREHCDVLMQFLFNPVA